MTSFILKAIPGILAQIRGAMMVATTLLLVSMMGASAVSSEAVRWFPGDFYQSRVRVGFQSAVMESWPGPSQLLQLWNDGQLDEPDRVSLLLGGAAFHDPVLLPAYREAMVSPSQRVRQAAVYGYRDLLADSLPDVRGVISDEDAGRLANEVRWVERTLSRRTLVELWLQSLLAHEELGLPGWDGVTLQRQTSVCLQAVEQLVGIEDLDLLLTAYDISGDFATRIGLLKLVEAVTLSRFLVIPKGGSKGWGRQVFTNAMDALAAARRKWSRGGCSVDGETVLIDNLRSLGVSGVDPLAADGCGVWLGVLDRGFPRWWMLASRRLYACGGPSVEISALEPDSDSGRELRNRLLEWYRPLLLDVPGSSARP
jgi:hypothetical protein